MSLARNIEFESGQTLRPCDTCGRQFLFPSEFAAPDSMGRVRCLATCAGDNGIREYDIDRVRAAAAGLLNEMPPPPQARELATKNNWYEEVRLFDALANVPYRDSSWAGGVRNGLAPQGAWDVTSGSGAASGGYSLPAAYETAIYLYNLITEGSRESRWLGTAQNKLVQLADWLMLHQWGNAAAPAGYAAVAADTFWGAFSVDSTLPQTCYSVDVSGGMLALLYAYEVTGVSSYLDAAKAAGLCLRRMQCGELRTTNFSTTTNLGTGRAKRGMWVHSMLIGTCASGPVAVTSQGVQQSHYIITFASAVTLSSITCNHFPIQVVPAVGSTSATFNFYGWTGLLTGPNSVSLALFIDQNDPCKAQQVSDTFNINWAE